MKRIAILALLLATVSSAVFAMGSLKSDAPIAGGQADIGDVVPNLEIVNSSGTVQRLLSMKAPVDFMVLGFFDPACPVGQDEGVPMMAQFEDMRDRYQEWGVRFYAVNSGSGTLQTRIPPIQASDRKLEKTLFIEKTPTFVIIDAWGFVRYRGPFDGKSAEMRHSRRRFLESALQRAIGYDNIPDPSPRHQKSCPLPGAHGN